MNNILNEIVAKTKKDLEEKKDKVSLGELRNTFSVTKNTNSFFESITKSINYPAVIAEVKLKSPSGGTMGSEDDLDNIVKQYKTGGADAISVITESHFFGGNMDFVEVVKSVVDLLVLMKDFVIDEYQIYEAKKAGADALLLIARLVDEEMLRDFVKLSNELGMEPVVEIYSEEELDKVKATETRFVAVNARDLDTFEVDVEKACRLMKKIQDRFIKLGFSGVESAKEVGKYREAGARGVLIGTSLMKAKNIVSYLSSIKGK